MASDVGRTSRPPLGTGPLSPRHSPPLLRLPRESRTRQRSSLLKPCSTRRVREFCTSTPKSDTHFRVHHGLPTINCARRSITSTTISEHLSSCVRSLEQAV